MLDRRTLNRSLLDRQMLARRSNHSAADALERLVGMQAQAPNAPYVGLWTRLHGFAPEELAGLIGDRRAVRTSLMRTTIHLVTARDCLRLRPVFQPLLERRLHADRPFGRHLQGMDIEELVAFGRALLEERPRTIAALGRILGERWPERDATSLAYAVRHLVPLVQVPPRGIWGASGEAAWTPVEAWLDRPLRSDPSPDQVILRYLAAFGPASVADIQAWSWLTRLREVVERLRPQLRTFRDESGRELLDIAEGPLPDRDTPVPPRYLPEFDNALLSHADRSRIIAADHRDRVFTKGAVLVDGFVRAAWKVKRERETATLLVEPLARLPRGDRPAVIEEGARLLDFVAGDARDRDVRLAAG
jgi:hypothetical protein